MAENTRVPFRTLLPGLDHEAIHDTSSSQIARARAWAWDTVLASRCIAVQRPKIRLIGILSVLS